LEKEGLLKFEGKIGKEFFFGFPDQRTGSISINESSNLWFDHSSGEGGDIIKAVQAFENKNFSDAIQKLRSNTPIENHIVREKQVKENDYEILQELEISQPALKQYIISRGLEPDLVANFCKELHWRHKDNVFFGIGLKNDNGGWNIRSKLFKGTFVSSGITTCNVGNRVGAIKIFEGMFDFLSYVKLFAKESYQAKVLNSTNNFSIKLMDDINQESTQKNWAVDLYLDNDDAGDEKTKKALEVISAAKDKRTLFKGFGDLNEMVIKTQEKKIKR
jgi:hypothetical protein